MAHLDDILIVGLGASGAAAARFCASLIGSEARSVTAVDGADTLPLRAVAAELRTRGVAVRLGTDQVDGTFDLAIVSPGVRPDSAIMRSARAASARVVSELEFAFSRSCLPWVAVTGTNGKTTTTALIAHLLSEAGIPARAIGNIGFPATEAVCGGEQAGVLVAEVSSFQLATIERFHPRVAVLLNVTPDHLDWHGSFERYVADKGRIFENMGAGDVAVIDIDDDGSRPFAGSLAARGIEVMPVSRSGPRDSGAWLDDAGRLMLVTAHGAESLCTAQELLIRGPHNVSNALAAAAAAHAAGAPVEAISDGLRTFRPIEHRLEPVGTARGAEWFNDSKATNPDATLKAIEAFVDRPLILLLGGRNKGNDFSRLATVASERARAVIVFGEAAPQIAAAFGGTAALQRASTLADAVERAAEVARPGDAVLLSPACASFDEFANFEERGRAFAALVAALEDGGSR